MKQVTSEESEVTTSSTSHHKKFHVPYVVPSNVVVIKYRACSVVHNYPARKANVRVAILYLDCRLHLLYFRVNGEISEGTYTGLQAMCLFNFFSTLTKTECGT